MSFPHVPIPVDEGGWQALLIRGVYLMGNFLRAYSGDGVCCLNLVWAEDGGVASVEGFCLLLHGVVAVGGQRRHADWAAV